MEYVALIIAVAALVLIYMLVRIRNTKKSCGRIACDPIVPVADREQTGVAEGERTVEDDTVKPAKDETCEKEE